MQPIILTHEDCSILSFQKVKVVTHQVFITHGLAKINPHSTKIASKFKRKKWEVKNTKYVTDYNAFNRKRLLERL